MPGNKTLEQIYAINPAASMEATDLLYLARDGEDFAIQFSNLTIGVRRVVSVSYASTVTPNSDTTDLLIVGALTGPITIAAPTGTPTDGQQLSLRLVQDSTGGHTATFNAIYRLPTGGAPELATAASKLTRFLFEYNAAAVKWDFIGNIPGY